jgi:hypothetical protein
MPVAPHAGGTGIWVTLEVLSGDSVRADRVRVGASTDFIQFFIYQVTDLLEIVRFHNFLLLVTKGAVYRSCWGWSCCRVPKACFGIPVLKTWLTERKPFRSPQMGVKSRTIAIGKPTTAATIEHTELIGIEFP